MSHYTVKAYGSQNRRVVFLLHGWGIKEWMVSPVGKLLAFAGFYCISYTFDHEILSPNLTITAKRLQKIRLDIEEKLLELSQDGYTDFNVFGTSLGAILGLIVVYKTQVQINKVIFNVPGISVARSLWQWHEVVPSFADQLKMRYPTFATLSNATKSIEPMSYIKGLQGKKVMLLISKNDDMVYCPEKRLHQLLHQHKLNPVVLVNPIGGHLVSGALNLLNFPVYVSFLK